MSVRKEDCKDMVEYLHRLSADYWLNTVASTNIAVGTPYSSKEALKSIEEAYTNLVPKPPILQAEWISEASKVSKDTFEKLYLGFNKQVVTHELHDGTIVELKEDKEICKTCDGKGMHQCEAGMCECCSKVQRDECYDNDRWLECENCNGTGEVDKVAIPQGDYEYIRFYDGVIPKGIKTKKEIETYFDNKDPIFSSGKVTCSNCFGTGRVECYKYDDCDNNCPVGSDNNCTVPCPVCHGIGTVMKEESKDQVINITYKRRTKKKYHVDNEEVVSKAGCRQKSKYLAKINIGELK